MTFLILGSAIALLVGVIAIVHLYRKPLDSPISVAYWRQRSWMMKVLGWANLWIALGSFDMYGVNPLLFISLLGAGAGFYSAYANQKFADWLVRRNFEIYTQQAWRFHVKRKDEQP